MFWAYHNYNWDFAKTHWGSSVTKDWGLTNTNKLRFCQWLNHRQGISANMARCSNKSWGFFSKQNLGRWPKSKGRFNQHMRTNILMWVKHCHKPPMTGNDKFIPPIKWWFGEWFVMVLPALYNLSEFLTLSHCKTPPVQLKMSTYRIIEFYEIKHQPVPLQGRVPNQHSQEAPGFHHENQQFQGEFTKKLWEYHKGEDVVRVSNINRRTV